MPKSSLAIAHPVRLAVVGLLAAGLLAGCGSSSPPSATTLLNQGIKAQVSGNLVAANTKFQAAIKADPRSKVGYYDLGLIQQEQGDLAAAETNYRFAIAVDPAYAPALYNLGIIQAKAGSKADAVDLYTKATNADPKFAPAFLNLGLLLDSMGKPIAGKAALRTAVHLEATLLSRIPAAERP